MCFRARAAELLVSSSDAASFASAKQEITRCLCTAAGVLDYIKDVELARWGEKPSAVSLLEKFAEFYAMLSTYVLRTNHRERARASPIRFVLANVGTGCGGCCPFRHCDTVQYLSRRSATTCDSICCLARTGCNHPCQVVHRCARQVSVCLLTRHDEIELA
jgi:hypothetical protein